MRGVRADRVREDARRFLQALQVDGELSIALVGDAEIRLLNSRYRKKDRATDVLAFPVGRVIRQRYTLLGDVVISLDTAARQARERGLSIADEVRILLAHGILHLLGYDHERSPAEARRMFAKQRRLVARLDSPS